MIADNEAKVEIYALIDPRTGDTRYIGKANNSEKRFKSHLRDSRRRKTPVYCWIQSLSKEGLMPRLVVLEFCNSSNWQETEKRIIAEYRKTHSLLNLADGGDEPFCSKEQRAANGRMAAIKRDRTPEMARIFRLKCMVCRALKQGYGSAEVRAKLRSAAIRRPDLFACFSHC